MSKKLGILGGMGPLATADFFYKLTKMSPAAKDQDHIEIVIYSACQIPDRSSAIVNNGASPLPAMLRGVSLLQDAGASVIAIPCNTAHFWHADLVVRASVPILHIAECVCDALQEKGRHPPKVGLLATTGTVQAGVYQGPMESRGFTHIVPSTKEQLEWVQPAIALVKAGQIDSAGSMLERAVDALLNAGAERIIMGCTEIPLALENSARATILLDATAALAAKCIAICQPASIEVTASSDVV